VTEVTSEPRIYMRHIRQAKRCKSGTQNWWVKHGLDWRDFVKNGIAGEVLVATGDPMALEVVEFARAERDG
jgi:hypothetical protein